MGSTARVDWILRIDFKLDYPVEEVWPFVIDSGEWITTHRNEHVSGPHNEVGEIIRIWYRGESGEEVSSFPVEVASIVENHSLIYRFLPDEALGLTGYEGFNLFPLGQKTFGTMSQYAVAESATKTTEQLQASITETNELLERLWSEAYIPALNKLLAQAAVV
jgi:hypothetical protein